ncbi:MAG: tetratricopeptide repeat protein [Deltaproteobacteria bacterium]|nr:tetratricopeptide repeat protein [Deltaproteobacteria bacterium]
MGNRPSVAQTTDAGAPARMIEARIRTARPTVVIGGIPELPPGIVGLRVACDVPGTLGVLERARATIEGVLDGDAATRWLQRERGASRAHRRLLAGDDARRGAAAAFVEACNQLAARAAGRIVLVLDGIDEADEDTHAALAAILRDRKRLRLPLLLVTHGDPEGSMLEILDALQEEAESPTVARAEPAPVAGDPPARLDDAPMPDELLRVLRAGATVGAQFDARVVARLLEAPIEEVLEHLQRARDLGIPVVDRGGGRFVLPEALAADLVESTLPSLRDRWHARLGELLGGPERAAAARPMQTLPPDPLRAARALDALGRATDALERRLDAVASMIDAGDVGRASKTLDETAVTIAGLTSVGVRALLEARLRLERARLLWLTTGQEGSGTLLEAWTEALAAWHAIPGRAPASLRAYAAATLASIAYEIGGGSVLDQAREILVDTVGALLQEGATADAASLINEQAALEIRRDRVAPAAELLERSRRLFEARVVETKGDAASRAELADTELLLARLPLHGNTGHETLEKALGHARAAEHTYRALGMRRELARACDVLGRLEARRGDTGSARPWFDEALAIAEELGDAGGLARTTVALAELLAEAGQPEQALGLLRSSISVNREKGSTIGLSFDAAALDVIEGAVARMGGAVATAMEAELAQVRSGLDDGKGPVTARFQ